MGFESGCVEIILSFLQPRGNMTAPIPPSADHFWHLTSTAWTAISSLVGAASVITLVVFNWRYLNWTHKLSDSAAEQAAIARDSLKKLEEQI
jgi:hypothetical protein